jgi:hypothetical protein
MTFRPASRFQSNSAGCSKSPPFSPTQPWRAETRLSAGKAARNIMMILLSLLVSLSLGWLGRVPHCARPTRVFRDRALCEHRGLTGSSHPLLAGVFSILLGFLSEEERSV